MMRRGYWNLIARYVLRQRGAALWMAALLLASIAFQVAGPQFLAAFIDLIQKQAATDALLRMAALFILVVAGGQVVYGFASYVGAAVGWSATNELRADLALHCLRLDLPFHHARSAGQMIERIDGDVGVLGNFFSQFVVQVVGSALLILAILALLFLQYPVAGLILTGYVASAALVLLRVQGIAVPHFRANREVSAQFSGFWEETISALEDIQGVGAQGYIRRRDRDFQRLALRRGRASMTMFRVFVAVFGLVFVVGNALAFLTGVWLMERGAMTLGAVYLLMYYTTLMAWTIARLSEQLNDFQQAVVAIGRIDELLHTQSALTHHLPGSSELPGRLAGAPPALEFENVCFAYTPDTPVLRDLSFRLEPGEVLGLVGRTGSGKSSLARLLFRFYDPATGAIRLDGQDIRTLPLEQLRASVGYVPQEVQLFHASVRDNLTFFDTSFDRVLAQSVGSAQEADAQITRVLEEAGLGAWLASLPHGLDTLLEGGKGLSTGEAQLLAFGRVFLKNPGLVVLDEATSRLDPATERLVEVAVDRLLVGRTAIVIAHRLSTVQRADKILVLAEGRALEFGPYAQLAADPASRFAAMLRSGLLADGLIAEKVTAP